MTFTEKLPVRAGAFAFALLLAPAAMAQARSATDIESARQLFVEGIQLRDRGDLKGALDKLRAAHALANTPVTGVELCRTHAALQQPVEAREVCLGVGRIPQSAQETARSQQARTDAPQIAESERPKIATLRLRLSGVTASTAVVVTVDDAAVPGAALAQPRAIDPGAHVVTASAGGAVARVAFEAKPGESLDIAVAVPPPSAQATAAPVPSTGPAPPEVVERHRSLALPITLFALGGTALFIGAVSGLKASSDKNQLDSDCVEKKCGREYHDELSSAKTWGNVSTAMFVVGGVFAAGGLVTLLIETSKPRRVQPTIGLGSVGLHGSF